jgi:hypothetical protein
MNFVAGALLWVRLGQDRVVRKPPVEMSNLQHKWQQWRQNSDAPSASSGPVQPVAAPNQSDDDGGKLLEWRSTWEQVAAEEDVFWLMCSLIAKGKLHLHEIWQPGVPQLKLRVFQFDRLLAREMPKLYAHFVAIGLAPDVLVSQWFLTVFAYSLPFDVLVRLWDIVFTDGWKMLFRIGLARLQAIQSELLQLNLEETSRFLRRWRDGHQQQPGSINVSALLQSALAIKVTNSILRNLQEEFGVQLLRERLSGGQGQWLMRYGEASQALLEEHVLDGLRAELGKLDSETFDDATVRCAAPPMRARSPSFSTTRPCTYRTPPRNSGQAFQKKIEQATQRLSLAEQVSAQRERENIGRSRRALAFSARL